MAGRKQILDDRKLQQWIESNLNVMFIGKHGTGKTSVITQAWDDVGLKWLYFSGSTLDPWVDFIGIPKKSVDAETGNSYIELIRPKAIANDEVEAIFIDEYNRCLTGDTRIKLADGTETAIKDLVGKDHFFVYSYNKQTKKVCVAKGHSARITKKNAKLIKVTLDNGQSVRCTTDHPFLTIDGHYVKAESLKTGQSLFPLYTKLSDNQKLSLNGYEMVYQPSCEDWEFTHCLADRYNVDCGIYSEFRGSVRHHRDYNKLNNSPENIIKLSWSEHKKLHKDNGGNGGRAAHIKHPDLYNRTLNSPASRTKALKNSLATRKNSATYKKLRSELSKKYMATTGKVKQSWNCKQGWQNGQFNDFDQSAAHRKRNITITCNWALLNLYDDFTKSDYKNAYESNYCRGLISPERIAEFFGSFSKFVRQVKTMSKNTANYAVNHKVVSVEYLTEREDVYDITVDEHHNFALASGIFVHNCHKKIRNAVMELIQFKSINGQKLKNLRMIWVAVNPDDDSIETYDVEKVDPAQKDRFHIHIEMPFQPSQTYFSKKYGTDVASQSIVWWKEQEEKVRNQISPRRLDYTLEHFQRNGDLNDVLPEGANIMRLLSLLKSTPCIMKLKELFDNKDEAGSTKFLADEDNFQQSQAFILGKRAFYEFFLNCMPREKISQLIADNSVIQAFALQNFVKMNSVRKVMEDIVAANVNTELCRKIDRVMLPEKEEIIDAAIKTGNLNAKAKFCSNGLKTNDKFAATLQVINNSGMEDTHSRCQLYALLVKEMPSTMDTGDASIALDILEKLAARSHIPTMEGNFLRVIEVVNTLVVNLVQNGNKVKNFKSKYPKLTKYISLKMDEFCYETAK